MERIGDDVARELRRHGPQAGMAELVAAWPAAVGAAVARNAWPARIARDGTVHVATADAIWAFELGHRAAEIAERLGARAVRFAPGPLPASVEEPSHAGVEARVEPTAEELGRAAEIAAAVGSAALRERIARAVALSLARAAREGTLDPPSVPPF